MQDLQSLLAKLKRSYLLGLCFIVFLLSFSFFTLSQFLQDQETDAKMINLAGKQRMLSQKLTLQVLMHQAVLEKNAADTHLEEKIITLAETMANNHLTLVNGTDPLSTLVRHLYFNAQNPLNLKIQQFTENAIEIASMKPSPASQAVLNNYFSEQYVESLLTELSAVVDEMEKQTSRRLLNIEKGVVILWIVTLIGLIYFTFSAFLKITGIVSNNFKSLKREKNKVADFEFAINKHSIVFRVSLEHKIQYVNEKFCQLYGYSQEEILGQHQSVLGSKEHDKSVFDEMHEYIAQGSIWKHELCNVDKNGWQYWLDTTVVPIKHNDRLISYMVIQNNITEQKLMGYALGEIHGIISNPKQSLDDKINQLLALGSELYHLPLGIVSEISGTQYSIEYAHSPNGEISPGDSFDLINTYCIHTLKANKPTSFHHVANSEIRNHPCYIDFGLESYIGCPIFVEGKRYGTLNFSSPEAHAGGPFTDNDLELIQLLAQWIGYEIMREQHQHQMLVQQTLMEQMSKQARIGAWEVDLVTNEITWSAMTKEIHEVAPDYQPDLLTAVNFYKEGENRDKITHLVETAMADGQPFQAELELVTAKGNAIWVATRGNAVFDDNKKCVKLYGSFQDITEQRRIEQDIIDKNRRMDLAADSAGIGVWELDLITNDLKWDDWMFRLYGIKPEDFSGAYQAWENGLHPDDLATAAQELQDAAAGKKKFNTQFRVVYPSGSIRYMKADALVLKNNRGEPVSMVGVNYDVTERVETELELTAAKELAEKASNVKNEFLASMSHEIRTPMNGVVGMLDLLSDTSLDKDQKHQLSVAKSSADSLLFLINDILDFSKIDANKLELEEIVFDVKLLVAEFADSMLQQAEQKGLELIVDTVDVSEPLVIGDPNRVRQIFTNLVSNAIKFTEQGEVLIKLMLLPETDDFWRLRVKVQDTGIGIAKDKQHHLFESFQQVDSSTTRKFGGTGLGLAIVKKLSQCMHGDVSLISDVDQGSIFICDLRVGKTAQVTPKLPEIDISHINVLVVDDNQTNREVLTKQLKSWNVDITSVSSAKAGLELCQNIVDLGTQPLFDIAILDMQMPEMDGAELGTLIRQDERFNAMKLVMMTSMHMQGEAKHFANIGFDAYFSKPATSSDLYNALNILVDNGPACQNAQPLITKHYIKTLNHTEPKKAAAVEKPVLDWPENSKVLLVEDNRINQMVAKGVLTKLNIESDVAVNGQVAIDKLREDDSFSLILMDCQMPVMDGYEATQKIRQGSAGDNNKAIPIVAMTANAMQGDREKCLNIGMDDYLTKPIDQELVKEKLLIWLNR